MPFSSNTEESLWLWLSESIRETFPDFKTVSSNFEFARVVVTFMV